MSDDRDDLVLGSHILARHGVVDGFGHISARDLANPNRFLIARSLAPALVGAADIMTVDLAGEPVADDRAAFIERFIHARIYAARPDVGAVVHSHSPSVIPFGITDVPLRPTYHMCGFLGTGAPVFEISDTVGDGSDMLIRNAALGDALAAKLGAAATVVMRGHGSTVVGATLRQAVFRAVYLEVGARIQSAAMQLGAPRFLSVAEAAAASAANDGQIDRAWQLWVHDLTSRTENDRCA